MQCGWIIYNIILKRRKGCLAGWMGKEETEILIKSFEVEVFPFNCSAFYCHSHFFFFYFHITEIHSTHGAPSNVLFAKIKPIFYIFYME